MKKIKQLFIISAISFSSLLWNGLSEAGAQNIGINTTGNPPNASAILDIDASPGNNKGLLIPRVALTNITDATTIATPATSLLVYNLGTAGLEPVGYYYNSGTAGSPLWIKINTDTKPKKQFVEYFSGNDLNPVWTKNSLQGTPTFGMADGINGGFRITCSGAQNGSITFNNVRHFDPTSCTFYMIINGAFNTRTDIMGGLSNVAELMNANVNKIVIKQDNGTGTGTQLMIGNGITESQTTLSGVTLDALNTFKVVCTASSVKAYLLVGGEWILKATDTTDLPTVPMQPAFECRGIVGGPGYTEAIYFMVQND